MAKKRNEYDITKDMISAIRGINMNCPSPVPSLIKEEKEKDDDKLSDAIAITDDPKFGQSVLSQQISQFKAIVDSGAEFSDPTEEDVASNPLILLPSNNNLIFSGVIPRLNNLKFQFLLKTSTGDGCFVWADGLILNNENFKTLSKLYGFYQNWCEAWNAESKDFETLIAAEKRKK